MNELRKTKLEFWTIYILLGLTFGTLVFMYLRISKTSDESAIEIIKEKKQSVFKELDLFFNPIHTRLEEECSNLYLVGKNKLDSSKQTERAFSMVRSSEAITSMVIADTLGSQEFYGKLIKSNRWYYIKTVLGNKTDILPRVKRWHLEGNSFVLDSQYVSKRSDYDPRVRPWFINAMKTTRAVWTEPYMFATSFVPGISLSKKVQNSDITKLIVFDIRLESLCIKSSNINVSESGFAFITTDSAKIIGLPRKAHANSSDSILKYVLNDIHELNDTMLSSVYDQWRNTNQNSFSFTNNDRIYWAQVSPYILGNINFYVGVVAPEDEIIGSIIKTKKILLLGILLISIVSVYIGYAYRQKIKTNKQLNEKNNIIENQKKEVDEKNREIIDSINYAKRIQNALLPSISNFDKNFNEYFVLYMPKDIVAGDFYWFQEHDRKVYLAVADCTGHGVPGAMVSVICINALNRVLKEFEITETGKLLDKTKELIIHEFEKSDSTVQDGMDIALVSIDFAKNEIQYSGANNSLWLIKSGEDRITEIKADKQPIGKYISETSFGTKKITMNKGDVYYLFSDGYADQFGGPKGKKFKYKQLNELLVKLSTKRMDKQQHELKQAFDFWRGALEQVDDVTLIGIRI